MRRSAIRSHKAKVFVISAPSGCGKTTLCDRLLRDGFGLANSISMTTRHPRPGEREGIDYLFVSRRRFLGMVTKRAFLEHEENFGNLYGTPARFVKANLAKGKPVLLSIDVKGAMKIRRSYPKNSVLIFILPPSIKALKTRLNLRRSETPAAVERRLSLAKKEMAYKRRYDYRIVNDKLEDAYKTLKRIVIKELEETKNA
ncbi:MAG: guanylate kinase [Candidatus Omnitrophica bacterium]|nr:guanylate kinase [Candidatus Omnitrophota bacterium]